MWLVVVAERGNFLIVESMQQCSVLDLRVNALAHADATEASTAML